MGQMFLFRICNKANVFIKMSTDIPLATAPEMPSSSDNGLENYAWNPVSSDNNDIDNATTSNSSAQEPLRDDKTTTVRNTPTAYSFSGTVLGAQAIDFNKENSNEDYIKKSAPADKEDNKNDDSMFECNICLDTAKDAVVSLCGHLFCWPCLHQWLETRPSRKLCPVCKAAIGKEKVIPLYGRNSTKQEDPRNKVPPRPPGQRSEPEPQQGFQGFSFGDGFHMSFGIGAFPFGYFLSSLNFGEPRPAPANRGTTQYEDEQQLSKLFLYLAFLCIAWLLFA